MTAGTLGIGSLNFAAGNDDLLEQKVKLYREAIAKTATTTRRTNNWFCCTPTCLVLGDDRKACEHGFRGTRFFAEALATYFFSPGRVVGPLEISRDPLSGAAIVRAHGEPRAAPAQR